MSLLLLFRKKARSARLFACKRAHNGSQSLPPFCEMRLRRGLISKRFTSSKIRTRKCTDFTFSLFTHHYSLIGCADFWKVKSKSEKRGTISEIAAKKISNETIVTSCLISENISDAFMFYRPAVS